MQKYGSLIKNISSLLENARRVSARSVNAILTATYWDIGRRIVEFEQGGKSHAEYGGEVIDRLANDLTRRFGKGFSRRNLFQVRAFYLVYPEIVQTASAQLRKQVSVHTSKVNIASEIFLPEKLAALFPLSWSHYVQLISVENKFAREFYETESLRCGWSVRQLERQINSLFYERTALSKKKKAMLEKGAIPEPGDAVSAEEEIRNPYVLEFLGLKDEYSENELEEALILHLERFLLELGGDFAFVGRQKRLRIGHEWYRVDLLFFHRKLRCLVIIDLKTGKFTPADVGQMHLYLNYAKEHWVQPAENPPVGLILCTQSDSSVARYALEGLSNKVLVREYRRALPEEKKLVREMEITRKRLESEKK